MLPGNSKMKQKYEVTPWESRAAGICIPKTYMHDYETATPPPPQVRQEKMIRFHNGRAYGALPNCMEANERFLGLNRDHRSPPTYMPTAYEAARYSRPSYELDPYWSTGTYKAYNTLGYVNKRGRLSLTGNSQDEIPSRTEKGILAENLEGKSHYGNKKQDKVGKPKTEKKVETQISIN